MDPARWKQLRELYDQVVDTPPADREAVIRRVCRGDEDLAADLRTLFEPGGEAEALFDGIISDAAATLLEPSLDGARIGPYEIVSELGEGGMGAVYLADRVDGQFEQRVALKIIKPGMNTELFLQRFRAERQILARLQHPNIARLLDGGVDDEGRPYFALEYVEGKPIDRYCDDHGLGFEQRLRLFEDVCRAVSYAHANLVVHRDIKPAHILVDEDGHVRLLDFGIAKVIEDEPTEPGLTQIGVRAMTPEYASPEQVRGEAIGTATDVYSLGIVLYELLTGVRPYDFERFTPAEIERVVCETDPPRPSSRVGSVRSASVDTVPPRLRPGGSREKSPSGGSLWRRRLRGDVDVICLKALQKEPARRYSSVEALHEDIRRNLAGLPVLARPDSLSYRTGKFAARNKGWLSVAAVVIAGFMAFGAYHFARLADERDRARVEADKAEQVASFLRELFEVSDPSASRGETITALELLDQGAARVERTLAQQPEVRASMMRLIGDVYRTLGLFSQARPLLEQALADHRSVFGTQNLEVAETEITLGTLLQDMGELGGAESLMRRGLETRRRLLGEEDPLVIEALSLLAFLLETRGDTVAAEEMARRVLALTRSSLPANDPRVAEATAELGGMLRREGRLDEAEPLLRQALEAQRALGTDYDLAVASTARNLASLLRDRRTPEASEEAEVLYEEAIAIRRRILGEVHPEVAVAINSYAMLLDREGDIDGAIGEYRALLGILEQIYDGPHPSVAAIYSNLAAALRARGEHDESALMYSLSIRMVDQVMAEDHPDRAYARVGLGALYVEQGRFDEAEDLLRQALAIRRAGLPEGHRYIGDALLELGDCLMRQERFTEAETLLLEARDLYRAGLGDDDNRTRRAGRRLDSLYAAWGR